VSDYDVIVLGAGVIGAAVAFELAASGYRVRVIDAREAGLGATQASAGVLAPYIEGHESRALSALGRRSLDLYDEFVDRVARAAERKINYGRIGTIEVALDQAHASRLRQVADALVRDGVETRWLDARETMAAEPGVAPAAVAALLTPMHGFVGAADLTHAMVFAAARHGAIFEHHTKALSVEPSGASLRVLTDAGRWEADRVVLAAGSWSGQVGLPGADNAPLRPVRGQLLVLRQPASTLQHIVWGRDCYLVPWPDGTVLVGATMEDVGFDEHATVHGVATLTHAAQALVPALEGATFETVRVGLRPAGPDELPWVGASTRIPGLIYAAGHFRNGVLLAPLTAWLVKQIVVGDTSDAAFASLAPSRAGL
jgi:glycine oxidase